MSIIFYVTGSLLILLTLMDLAWTTLWIDGGAGPLSKKIARSTWRIIEKLTVMKKGILNLVGPVILVTTLLSWVFFIWLGLFLFYSADPQSIIDTQTAGPITWYERVYFTGYSLFTLGIGDYSPQPGFWQVFTAVTSGIGILFLTLGASYVINVVNAVVSKRSFALTITGLGMYSEKIISDAWNGHDFHQLDLVLMNASSSISLLTQQHQAYPLLHFYHSRDPSLSSAVGVAILDDVLTILHFGLKDKGSVNAILVNEARSSVETYIETLTSAFGHSANEEPKRPMIKELENRGVPLTSEEDFSRNVDSIIERRKKILSAVYSDNHEWPEYKKEERKEPYSNKGE